MKTKITLLLLLLCGYSQAQRLIDKPLSSAAFDSLVVGNLNYMVLGDNNKKEGVAFEYKEDRTELTLSGQLWSKNGFIMTVDGKFAISSSAFIFDNNNASKKGKLSLNFFFNGVKYVNSKNFKTGYDADGMDTKRAMIKNDFDRRAMAQKLYQSIMEYEVIMHTFDIPFVRIQDEKFDRQRVLLGIADSEYEIGSYSNANEAAIVKKIKKYSPTIVATTLAGVASEVKRTNGETLTIENKDDKKIYEKTLPKDVNTFKIDKLLDDYQKAYDSLVNYSTNNNTMEIANFKKHWTSERHNYFGVSPFYERQAFDIYTPTLDNSVEFANRFEDIKTDLYGLNYSYNFVYIRKQWFLIIRHTAAAGRSNNFTDYSNKEYSFSTLEGNVNSVPIITTEKVNGYMNKENKPYTYGTFTESGIEVYFSSPIAGIFGRLGYKNNSALINRETYPLEAGVMINLKSDKKNIVAVQLFMSRENLKVHPDENLFFGLKVGLPINISKG